MVFRVGDRVKIAGDYQPHTLERDTIYVVNHSTGNGIEVEGYGQLWSSFFFELVERPAAEPQAPQENQRSITRWIVIYSIGNSEVLTSTYTTEIGATNFANARERAGHLLAKKKITLRY